MSQNMVDERSGLVNLSGLNRRFWKVTILCIIVFIIAGTYLNPRSISYILYYLNWYHWPRWYSANLWILAVGAAVNYFVHRKNIRVFLYVCILGAIFIVTAIYSSWLHVLLHRTFCLLNVFHYTVFRPYFYAPLVELFSNGTVTLRLFIAPVTGLVLVSLVLIFRYVIYQYEKTKTNNNEP